jgi:hypothetical protein
MKGYDRHWGSRYDSGFGWNRSRPGSAKMWGFADSGRTENTFGEGTWRRSPYDRGIYGGGYPGFGGYPGGRERGTYYGDRVYGRDFSAPHHRGRWDYGGVSGRYDRGFARQPFMPHEAYERHPEYDRPQRHTRDRWPGDPGDLSYDVGMEDDEIQQAVRQSLYQDNWVDADRLQVEVNGGVVTLTGEVDDYLEARYAWDDAWETPGVRGVINHIAVRVDGPPGLHDSVIQTSDADSES